MTAAQFFVEFRKQANEKKAEGFMDLVSQLPPEAIGALAGGTLGGISGLFSDESGSVARRALVGAGLGGLGGFGYRMLNQGNADGALAAKQGEPGGATQPQAFNSGDVTGGIAPAARASGSLGADSTEQLQDAWDKNPQRKLHVFDNDPKLLAANAAEIGGAQKRQQALAFAQEHPKLVGGMKLLRKAPGVASDIADFATYPVAARGAGWAMRQLPDMSDLRTAWGAGRY